jgi:DNA mismatch endonuclease (patch repair protein)
MTDVFTQAKRSTIMRKIGPKDSIPEKFVRSLVHRLGYRFRLHARDLPGTPDIVLPRFRKVIFMHSCFFHGHKKCKRAIIPKTRRDFWKKKIENNSKRDRANSLKLKQLGWDSLVIWQCEIKESAQGQLTTKIADFLRNKPWPKEFLCPAPE